MLDTVFIMTENSQTIILEQISHQFLTLFLSWPKSSLFDFMAGSSSSTTPNPTIVNSHSQSSQGSQGFVPPGSIRGFPPTEREYTSLVNLYAQSHEISFDLSTGTTEDALKWLGHEVELVRRFGHGLYAKQLALEKQLNEMRTELQFELSGFQESSRNTHQNISFALQNVSTFE